MPSFGPAAPGCSLDKEVYCAASTFACFPDSVPQCHLCKSYMQVQDHIWHALAPPTARTRICANAGLTYDCVRVLNHPVQKACRDIVSLLQHAEHHSGAICPQRVQGHSLFITILKQPCTAG